MARRRRKAVDYLAYLLVRLLARALALLSARAAAALAGWAGRTYWRLHRRHRRIAEGHVRRSFPDWPDDRVVAVAKASFENVARLAVEVLTTPRRVHAGNWQWHLHMVNTQAARALLDEAQTGVILLTGHFGNWEILGYGLALMGVASYALARPLGNPFLNRYLVGIRQRHGLRVLDKHGAARDVYRLLERQEVVGFIADQDAGPRGEFVDFFGRPASTYRIIAQAAVRYGTPVVIGYGRRVGGDFEFEVGVERILRPQDWAGQADPVRWITQEYTAALEAVIRRDPEQYLWVHRRWRHRPDGSKVAGDGVA